MRNNVEENKENTEDIKTLLTVAKVDGEYYLFHKKDVDEDNLRDREKAYEAIKYCKRDSKKYKGIMLKKALKIKIGRITFTVKDFSTSSTNEREEEKRLIDILEQEKKLDQDQTSYNLINDTEFINPVTMIRNRGLNANQMDSEGTMVKEIPGNEDDNETI